MLVCTCVVCVVCVVYVVCVVCEGLGLGLPCSLTGQTHLVDGGLQTVILSHQLVRVLSVLLPGLLHCLAPHLPETSSSHGLLQSSLLVSLL